MIIRAGLIQLMLQIERDLVAQALLKKLTTDLDAVIARRKDELRILKASAKRSQPVSGQRTRKAKR